MTDPCPACGGPPVILGTLGAAIHYRCRDCGWTYCREPVEDECGQATDRTEIFPTIYPKEARRELSHESDTDT